MLCRHPAHQRSAVENTPQHLPMPRSVSTSGTGIHARSDRDRRTPRRNTSCRCRVIVAWSALQSRAATQQIELLTAFADQAAIAIENVRLFDEVQDKNRQLQLPIRPECSAGNGRTCERVRSAPAWHPSKCSSRWRAMVVPSPAVAILLKCSDWASWLCGHTGLRRDFVRVTATQIKSQAPSRLYTSLYRRDWVTL